LKRHLHSLSNETIQENLWFKGNLKDLSLNKTETVKKEITPEDRIKNNQRKVMNNYDVILSLNSWLTVKLAINQPEPAEIIPEEVVDPVPAGKQPAKGKKK